MTGRVALLYAIMAALIVAVGAFQSWIVALTILNLCLISAVMALGVNIQWGYAGLFNAGVMGFAALGGIAVVLVSVPPVAKAIELVAHEMEHVIERVEGRDLPREARRRGSGVLEAFRGRFESRRAIDVGRQVAREVEESRRQRR